MDDDEDHPGSSQTSYDTANDTQSYGSSEEDLLGVLVVSDGTTDRTDQGNNDCDDGYRNGIVSGSLVTGDLARLKTKTVLFLRK